MTMGKWHGINRMSDDGNWRQAPYFQKYLDLLSKGADVCINALGYGLRLNGSFRMTMKPWFYDMSDKSAIYRIVNEFTSPPYPVTKNDTAYVEFQIRQIS